MGLALNEAEDEAQCLGLVELKFKESETERVRKVRKMRGIGGPLLCVGDLLSDLGESDDAAASSAPHHHETSLSSSPSSISTTTQPLDLTNLFQVQFPSLISFQLHYPSQLSNIY